MKKRFQVGYRKNCSEISHFSRETMKMLVKPRIPTTQTTYPVVEFCLVIRTLISDVFCAKPGLVHYGMWYDWILRCDIDCFLVQAS